MTLKPEEKSWEREQMLEALESYRRGLGEPPVLRKWGSNGPSKAGVDGDDTGQIMAFVISTDDVDRHGDEVMAEGWRLEAYRRNPVFLWAHDYSRPVIGRAAHVWPEPHRLLASIEFAPTTFAQEVGSLYRAGYQRGVSVGFKPLRYEERRHEKTGAFLGIRFLEQELLETSAVPVPANRSALRRALDRAPRVGQYLRQMSLGSVSEPHIEMEGPDVQNNGREPIWPQLAARVDDLEKLAEELGEMVAREAPDSPSPAGSDGFRQILAILRDARSAGR